MQFTLLRLFFYRLVLCSRLCLASLKNLSAHLVDLSSYTLENISLVMIVNRLYKCINRSQTINNLARIGNLFFC